MDLRLEAACVVAGILVLALITIALKRARFYPAYAALWSGIGVLLVLLPTYADVLRWLAANVFGIVGANHLVYVMLFGFIMIYLFYLTQKVCELTNRVERIIVSLAILENVRGSDLDEPGTGSQRAWGAPVVAARTPSCEAT